MKMTPEERKAYDRVRLRTYKKKQYWEQQEKRFALGIRQYPRRPNFNTESLCRKCGVIWPKCYMCPNCHIKVKNTKAISIGKNDEVFRY